MAPSRLHVTEHPRARPHVQPLCWGEAELEVEVAAGGISPSCWYYSSENERPVPPRSNLLGQHVNDSGGIGWRSLQPGRALTEACRDTKHR